MVQPKDQKEGRSNTNSKRLLRYVHSKPKTESFCHRVCVLSVRWYLERNCLQVRVPKSSNVYRVHRIPLSVDVMYKCLGERGYKCCTVLGGMHITSG